MLFKPKNSSWSQIDLPAPCKVFPKTPKIALTIEDVPQTEFQRRKSSGSSVHSNSSAIEPHIYEFQENDRHAESSNLVIRYVIAHLAYVCVCILYLITHLCALFYEHHKVQ
jgi:hypothetical protein